MTGPLRRVLSAFGLLALIAVALPAWAHSGPKRLSAEAYARKQAPTPPMGWNSWNHFAHRINARIVREEADAMVASGMKAAGYQYINVDDTWEGKRKPDGEIQGNAKFPNMKALVAYVHSKGLKFGIYSSPGPKTCAGFTGSYGHVRQDAETYAKWGVDYLKYDWCSAGRKYKPQQLKWVYTQMAKALRATGRPIVFSLCEYGWQDPWKWAPAIGGNLWRTTGDINDSWARMTAIGFHQSHLARYAGPGHWNDPDMLEIGNGGMTNTEYRTQFSLWSMLAAPLIAGNDLRHMSAATREILTNREVIAVDQDPAGHQGYRVARDGHTEVWAKPLSHGQWAMALFNRGGKPARVTATWGEIGQEGPMHVRDLWAHADRGVHPHQYSAMVPSHGVVMIRVWK